MVLKYNEFINEGLWSKTLNRGRTGKVRLEDKHPVLDFLKEAEWVDMGHPKFLFCKTQMDHKFSIDEIHWLSKILKNKYQIMHKSMYYWLKRKFSAPIPVNRDVKNNLQFYIGDERRKIYFGSEFTHFTPILYLDDSEGKCEYMYLKTWGELKISTSHIPDPSYEMYEIKFLKPKDENFEF